MKARFHEHGIRLEPGNGNTVVDVVILHSNPQHGTFLRIKTEHDHVDVRITPAGRKVEAASYSGDSEDN